jgi:hypothetical protein
MAYPAPSSVPDALRDDRAAAFAVRRLCALVTCLWIGKTYYHSHNKRIGLTHRAKIK